MRDEEIKAMFKQVLNTIQGIDVSVTSHSPIIVSCLIPHLTHYDNTIKTANGFLYKHNSINYLVTTTHLLFDTNKSLDSEKTIKVVSDLNGRKTLNNYSYSRFFDVAVFKLTDIDLGELKGFDDSSISEMNPKNANVKFLDTNTGNEIHRDSKYINITHSSIEMGAVCDPLIEGSSGAAVTDDLGNLIGMVSSCGKNYENMALCVPASVIKRIVESATCVEGGNNYDASNSFYPGIVTTPLQMGHLLSLPESVQNGECVVVSDNSINLKPFDIVTSCVNSGQSVSLGKDNKLQTQVLINSTTSVNVLKLNSAWRDTYGALPRCVTYDSNRSDLYHEIKLTASYYRGQTGKEDFLIEKGGEHDGKIRIMWNPNSDIMGNLSDPSSPEKLLYKNIVYPGQTIKIIDNNDKEYFVTVLEIQKMNVRIAAGGSVTRTILRTSKKLDRPMVKNIIIYPISSIYTENANNNSLGVFDITQSFEADKLCIDGSDIDNDKCNCAILTNLNYKIFCINFVIKYWAFLVCSSLTKLPMGQQHIVWANETKRLFNILPQGYVYDNKFTLVMAIFYKLLEFNDISVMNLLNIFLQNMIQHLEKEGISLNIVTDMEQFVVQIKEYFPIIENTNSLSTSINVFGKILNYVSEAPPLQYEGTIVYGENSNKLFEIIEIMSGNRIKVRPFQELSNGMSFKIDVVDADDSKVTHSYTINSVPETILLTDNVNGDSTFNADGFSAEYFHLKNTIAKAIPRELENDNVNQNLELCYKELEYLCDDNTDFGDDGLYYPRFFGLLKCFWDHAYVTLGGIMTTLDSNAFDAETNVDIIKSVLPTHLGTWNFDRLLHRGSRSFC